MIFKDKDHRSFWIDCINKSMRNNIEIDSRIISFFYVLGLSKILINHINDIFDWNRKSIITSVMKKKWLSSDDLNKMRIAFYFYCDWCYESDVDASIGFQSENYSLNSFFAEGMTIFLQEALRLRYQLEDPMINRMILKQFFSEE